uniref:Kinesin-associated protein 3 n=1 Tax=Clastoptera arizonana TaxID=38151 RepID=A0A1B6CKI3_9HEMI
MQPEDAKFIKRRVRSGSIDVHPTETALIVNYELEAVILGESGDAMFSDKKECQKIIRLKKLDSATDCAVLAREVVQKCTLIHPSKTAEVEHLIYYLQSRKENAFSDNTEMNSGYSSTECPSPAPQLSDLVANFAQMEQYLELLYEDFPEKIKGSAMILELAKDPNNLQDMVASEPVLSALSRVLREDWKKSIELSTNIVYTFFCFSTFSQFHPVVLQYKVGSLCLEIIDYELNRYIQLKKDLDSQNKETPTTSTPVSVSRLPVRSAATSPPSPVSKLPIPRSARRPVRTPTEDKKKPSSASITSIREPVEDQTMNLRKLATLAKKQDQLLRVCFYLLLNLAENVKVEDKMRKKNVVGLLVNSLDRNTVELCVLVATFLHKLSLFKENKDEMANLNVIDKLPKLFLMKDKTLEIVTLKLLFNLSFDTKLRDKMVKVGFLPKLVSMLDDEEPSINLMVLKILYHLSMDDRVKTMFPFTDCVPKVMNIVLNYEPVGAMQTAAISLAVNLALNQRCAEIMCEGERLQTLIERAFEYQLPTLMTIARNISLHNQTKKLFIDFVGDLTDVLVSRPNDDFSLECLGVLSMLILPELDYSTLLTEYNLVPWIKSQLVPNKVPDDFVLEVVMLVATAASDEACASLLCKADVLLCLIELLKVKQEDDEMVLQIVYVFYQISRHSTTRDYLIRETIAPAYMIDLIHDKNESIRKVCDACLEIIKECDEEWLDKIKTDQFEWHNAHWLEMVENKSSDETLLDDNDGMPNYNILNHQSLFLQTDSRGSINGDDIEIASLSNNALSEDGSRPVSRYETDFDDLAIHSTPVETKDDVVKNALMNLNIAEDTFSDDQRYFHLMQ